MKITQLKITQYLQKRFWEIEGLEDFFQEIIEEVDIIEKVYIKKISDYWWDEKMRDSIRRGSDII